MIFDQPPRELPVATLRARTAGAALSSGLHRWTTARWSWLRPRMVPVVVAFVGMLAVIGAGRYLANLANRPCEQLTLQPPDDQVASHPILEITTSTR